MSDHLPPVDLLASHALSDTIAARIRAHRKRLGLSREDLVRACARIGAPELSFPALTNIETGRPHPETGVRRRCLTIDEVAFIERALGVRLMDPIPPCETCNDQPPSGFACRTCGAES